MDGVKRHATHHASERFTDVLVFVLENLLLDTPHLFLVRGGIFKVFVVIASKSITLMLLGKGLETEIGNFLELVKLRFLWSRL